MQKGPYIGGKGTIPAEFNSYSRVFQKHEVLNHQVPHFLSLFGHTHSEVGWPFLFFFKKSLYIFLNIFFLVCPIWLPLFSLIFIGLYVCNSQHRLHPSSIRCRGSNSRPLDHELSALTTRPWLLALGWPFLHFY